jgi:hypothetical protein
MLERSQSSDIGLSGTPEDMPPRSTDADIAMSEGTRDIDVLTEDIVGPTEGDIDTDVDHS